MSETLQEPARRSRMVRCPSCAATLKVYDEAAPMLLECAQCRRKMTVLAFSASAPDHTLTISGAVATEGEAACFFHPEKRAERNCEHCGRFICALCDLPIGSRRLCPTCVSGGLEQQKLPELVNQRTNWDHLTFQTGVIPLFVGWLFFPVLLATGPAAIFFGIYGWNKPGSVVHGRRRFLAGFGMLGGLLQIAALVALVIAIYMGMQR